MNIKNKKVTSLIILTFLVFLPKMAWGDVGGVAFPTSGETGLSDTSIADILSNVLNWLLSIIGIGGLIAFVVAGGQYILSSGDDKRAESGKKNMVHAIIGILIALGAFVIIRTIDYLLN